MTPVNLFRLVDTVEVDTVEISLLRLLQKVKRCEGDVEFVKSVCTVLVFLTDDQNVMPLVQFLIVMLVVKEELTLFLLIIQNSGLFEETWRLQFVLGFLQWLPLSL